MFIVSEKSVLPIRLVLTLTLVFTLPLFSFPSAPHPNVDTFDWSVAFYLGLLSLVLPWYFFRAKNWYQGPGEQVHHA